MTNYKTTIIVVQAVVIIGLLAVLFSLLPQSAKEKTKANDAVVYRFDEADLERVTTMVDRFAEGKGDNLTIVSPTMDSGPVIHDVISNGREIDWTIDNSRDAWGANAGKTKHVCRAIRIKDRDKDFIDVQLSKCDNFKADEQLTVLTFGKDEL